MNMSLKPILNSVEQECPRLAKEAARPTLCHPAMRPTHVDTVVAASMLLVDSKTLLKSHSQKGNYSGIRPVRLPSRKLAWPLADIEKLLNIDGCDK
ncbi:hypothetical protein [Paraburkholderia largidicola]|uniref:Uncharacterized protein n=1 Tax=Paraburkholderia largidicola TaxID=3014751 RepID=A0A7I8BF51_9BURK|nr:hypothetical protein [Paraburkholderia sp. PGU16]BCF87063.1 hypothetical protein PPGU16_01300 [Paraburkholderia sp. PGU16]